MRIARWFRLLKWRYEHGLFWWQYRTPHKEFRTFLVEGKKGEGKSRFLAGYGVRLMRGGVRVCSNYTICDLLTGRRSEPITGWLDVLEKSVEALREGIPTMFIIDEFHLWADSRNWTKVPDFFKAWLAQSRHYGVGLCGAVQNFKTVDLRVRQITDDLTRIRKVRLGRVPLFRFEVVAPDSVDAEGGYALESAELGWFPWFAGYDTRELIQVEEWRTDEEIEARIAVLTAEAAALVAPGEFPVFEAYERARLADLERGGRFDDGAVPSMWEDENVWLEP